MHTGSTTDDDAPIRPAVFHILMALSETSLHGLGIADEVEHETDGGVRLGPGTLYRSLKEMARAGLVREASPPAGEEDPRRKFYRITESGREALAREAARYERIVEVARARRVLPEAR